MNNRNQTDVEETAEKGTSGERKRPTAIRNHSREKRATQIALTLREWLAKNPGVGTIKRLSATSGVPYSTLKKIASARHPPSDGTLRRLIEQGGVECLREWLRINRQPKGVGGPELGKEKRTGRKHDDTNENEQRVRRIVGTFYSLKDQLDTLKGENEQGRELFRKYMSKRDAAYIVALLQALFSEDEFQKWIFFSEYRPGGTKR